MGKYKVCVCMSAPNMNEVTEFDGIHDAFYCYLHISEEDKKRFGSGIVMQRDNGEELAILKDEKIVNLNFSEPYIRDNDEIVQSVNMLEIEYELMKICNSGDLKESDYKKLGEQVEYLSEMDIPAPIQTILIKAIFKGKDLRQYNFTSDMSISDVENLLKKDPLIFTFAELANNDYVIVDAETTGLNSEDVVIELGIIDKNGSKIYEQMFNTDIEIDPGAAKVNHIGKQDLEGKPTFKDEWPKIKDILDGKLILAFNSEFDKRLILQTAEHENMNLTEVEETMKNTKCVMRFYMSYSNLSMRISLKDAAKQEGVYFKEQTHRSIDDCLLTYKLIDACIIENKKQTAFYLEKFFYRKNICYASIFDHGEKIETEVELKDNALFIRYKNKQHYLTQEEIIKLKNTNEKKSIASLFKRAKEISFLKNSQRAKK